MSFLPLPPSMLRQLAEERLPRRFPVPHDAAPVGSRRPSGLRGFELTVVESLPAPVLLVGWDLVAGRRR